MAFPSPETIRGLLTDLVDAEYTRAAGAVVDAIARPAESGRLALRLKEYQDAAAGGKPVDPNSAVVVALLNDLQTTLRANAALVDSASPSLQSAMVKAAGELTKQTMLAQDVGVGAKFHSPDPAAIAALVQYVDSQAWADSLSEYQAGTLTTVQNIAIRGFVGGQNPRETARLLSESVTNLPLSYAQQMMRSLQMTALRDAAVVYQVANADVISHIIRVAALDGRTCLACVALHGTRLEVGERVNDHRNGRCLGIAVTKSRATEKFVQTYQVDGSAVQVSNGEEWLRAHKTAWQSSFMGPANYGAYTAGAVQLSDFVKPYDDKLFGKAIQEASLKGILGEQAKDYYSR